MIFGLFRRRARADQRRRGTAASGARQLAVGGSAAGVVVVAAGVAILAAGGGHPAPHTPAAHLGVAGITVHRAEVVYPSAAYPPHNPCSLSLVRGAVGSSDTTVEGNGLGAGQPVTVDYYSGSGSAATVLGSWRADGSGSFTASVDVPGSSADSAVVTAQSPTALCAAPRTNGDGYPPTTGTPTTSPPVVSTPPTTTPPSTRPTTSGAPTSGGATTSSGTGTTGSAGPSSGSTTGAGTSNGATAPGGTGPRVGPGGGPGGSGQPTGTSTGGTPSSGAPTGGPSSSGTSTGSSHPTASPSPTTTPASLGAQSWGLPTSFIVTMALVLLVLGGLAVLVLTRRSS